MRLRTGFRGREEKQHFIASAVNSLDTAPAMGSAGLDDLTGEDGLATARAGVLVGNIVNVRGYLTPTNRPNVFIVTSECAAPCQMCGALHSAGSSVSAAFLDDELRSAAMTDLVHVTGRLEILTEGPFSNFRPQVRLGAATGYVHDGNAGT